MKVYLNEINGIADAIVSLHMSKRSWSREMEEEVQSICRLVLDERGFLKKDDLQREPQPTESRPDELDELKESEFTPKHLQKTYAQFEIWMDMLERWGKSHTTLLRYVDFSCTVEGMHRAAQDDWDSHAKRFNNRILRSSTRLASFEYEMSDWYKGKIISTDAALDLLGINVPNQIEIDGIPYVKGINGYIRKGLESEQDVKRGLYMLSIPSNFIFRCDITEWSHVYKERNAKGTAHPEVQECCEAIADLLFDAHRQFNRDLFDGILN